MKLYRTHAGWFGTQADARTSSRDFETVEVPTDKPGLLRFLNTLSAPAEDEFVTVVERQDPPVEPGGVVKLPADLDTLFANAPIRQRLRLAVTAIDAADEALRFNQAQAASTKPEPSIEELFA